MERWPIRDERHWLARFGIICAPKRQIFAALHSISGGTGGSRSEGKMDHKHFYRMGGHSGAWDDLPADPTELDSLTDHARKHVGSLAGQERA